MRENVRPEVVPKAIVVRDLKCAFDCGRFRWNGAACRVPSAWRMGNCECEKESEKKNNGKSDCRFECNEPGRPSMNNRAQFIFEYLNYLIYWSNNNTQFYVKRIEIYLCVLMLAELRRLSERRRKQVNRTSTLIESSVSNAMQVLRRPLRKWHLE